MASPSEAYESFIIFVISTAFSIKTRRRLSYLSESIWPAWTPFSRVFWQYFSCQNFSSRFSGHASSVLPTEHSPVMVCQGKRSCNMHVPSSGMVGDLPRYQWIGIWIHLMMCKFFSRY